MGEGSGPQRQGKGLLPGGLHVFGSLTGGITDRPRGGDTHQISAVRPVQSLLSQRVRLAEGLPAGAEAVVVQLQARGVFSRPIAHSYEALGLVKSEPPAHPAPEQLRHFLRVGLKAPGGLRVLPAALPLQCLGKVPMEQSHPGLDSLLQKAVHQLTVAVQPRLVPMPVAFGVYPGPGNRESISLEAHLLHDGDVVPPAVIGVGGRVAGIAPFDLSGGVGENVPNAFSPAVLSHGALNLIRGGSGAPNKILWKSHGSSSFFVI